MCCGRRLHPLLLRAGRSLDDAAWSGGVEYGGTCLPAVNQADSGPPDALVAAAQWRRLPGRGYASEAVHWYQRVLAERGRSSARAPASSRPGFNLAKA